MLSAPESYAGTTDSGDWLRRRLSYPSLSWPTLPGHWFARSRAQPHSSDSTIVTNTRTYTTRARRPTIDHRFCSTCSSRWRRPGLHPDRDVVGRQRFRGDITTTPRPAWQDEAPVATRMHIELKSSTRIRLQFGSTPRPGLSSLCSHLSGRRAATPTPKTRSEARPGQTWTSSCIASQHV